MAKERLTPYEEQGNTVSFLLIDDRLVGLVALGDIIKAEAKNFIQSLKEKEISLR